MPQVNRILRIELTTPIEQIIISIAQTQSQECTAVQWLQIRIRGWSIRPSHRAWHMISCLASLVSDIHRARSGMRWIRRHQWSRSTWMGVLRRRWGLSIAVGSHSQGARDVTSHHSGPGTRRYKIGTFQRHWHLIHYTPNKILEMSSMNHLICQKYVVFGASRRTAAGDGCIVGNWMKVFLIGKLSDNRPNPVGLGWCSIASLNGGGLGRFGPGGPAGKSE